MKPAEQSERLIWLLSLTLIGCSQQPPPKTTPPALQAAEHQATAAENPTSQATRLLPPKTASEQSDSKTEEAVPSVNVAGATEPAPVKTSANASSFQETAAPAEQSKSTPDLTNFIPVDLSAHYQVPVSDFGKIPPLWREVPTGNQTFGNVPIEIGGMICLWGSVSAAKGLVFPERIDAIPVGRKFEALYLYHATFNQAVESTPVVKVVFNYGRDESATTEIQYGTHVRDWFLKSDEPEELGDPKSKKVWDNSSHPNPPRRLQFFITEITNTRPSDEVVSLDFISAKQIPASCVMAITTGPAGKLKMEPHKGE